MIFQTNMTLKYTKCNIFFTIGFLCFTFFLGCKSEHNTDFISETNTKEKSIKNKLITTNQKSVRFKIDEAALLEMDQWTPFFILKKEIEKLEQNKANGFQENAKRLETYFKELDVNMPEIFNTNTIWARLKVLETELYLYNEFYSSNGPEDLKKSASVNSLTAYQNLIRQINKTHEKGTQNIAEP